MPDYSKFEQVGRSIEEILDQVDAYNHELATAWYNYVYDRGIHRRQYSFTDEEKAGLVQKLINTAKQGLTSLGLRIPWDGMDEETVNLVLRAYAGMDEPSLESLLRKRKRITPNFVEQLKEQFSKSFVAERLSYETRNLDNNDVEQGKQYIKELADKLGEKVNLDNITDVNVLKQYLFSLHAKKRTYELSEETI